MNNRRNFFKSLIALLLTPIGVKAANVIPQKRFLCSVSINIKYLKNNRWDVFNRAMRILENSLKEKGFQFPIGNIINLLNNYTSLPSLCKDGFNYVQLTIYDDLSVSLTHIYDKSNGINIALCQSKKIGCFGQEMN